MNTSDVQPYQSITRPLSEAPSTVESAAASRAPRPGSAQPPIPMPIVVPDRRVAAPAISAQTTTPVADQSTPVGATTTARPPETLRPRVIVPPRIQLEQDQFKSLQKWEGVVTQVAGDSFWARVVDLTSPGSDDEEVEFALEEVPPADCALVLEGAAFYWNIGYRDSATSGQRTRVSEIRFKRIAPPTKTEWKRAEERADHLSNLLGWK